MHIKYKPNESRRRQRVYGEVFTPEEQVSSMIDLVDGEISRIDSRILEPSCGTGNFLVKIYEERLKTLTNKHKKSTFDFEIGAIIAISSMYGIEIQEDNVDICRARLENILRETYPKIFGTDSKDRFIKSVKYIINKNIIHGDSLSMFATETKNKSVEVSEWSHIGRGMIKERVFSIRNLLEDDEPSKVRSQCPNPKIPIYTYPLKHYLGLYSNGRAQL
jgi:hypothetical protein